MSIKPDNLNSYPDIEKRTAVLAKWRSEADRYNAGWHPHAKEDIAFRHGHQWAAQDVREMGVTDDDVDDDGPTPPARPRVTFNRIASIIHATYGAMIHNPMQIGYVQRRASEPGQGIPRHEALSSAASYFRRQPVWNAEVEERDSCLDMLTCGIGVQQMMTDNEVTGDVELAGRRRDPLAMGWDSRARAVGLTDRRWHFYKVSLSEEEMDAEFGGHYAKRPADDQAGGSSAGPEGPGVESDDNYEVLHWQWFEPEEFKYVLVPDAAMGTKRKGIAISELEGMAEGFDYVFANDTDRNEVRKRRRYWEAFTYGGSILRIQKVGVNAFTFLFLTGLRDDHTGYWYGMVRDAKDPQRWANKFLSLFIEIVATSGKGIIVEDGVFDNIQDAHRDWSNPRMILTVLEGAVSGGKIMPKPESKLPPSAYEILAFCNSAVREVTGISLETVAQQMNDQSGVVEESRKAAAMAVVAWAFASLRDYYRAHGHLLLQFIIEYIPRDRLVRMVTAGQEFFAPVDYQEATYEVEVDEIPDSPNKRAEIHRTLVAYAPIVQQPDIPSAFKMEYLMQMAETSGLPGKNLDRLKASVAQPDPMAEQMKQIQMEAAQQALEKTKAEIAELVTQAMLNAAKARGEGQDAETAQRIAATEIQQQAIEGQMKLELQREKTLQEIEKGDMKLRMDAARNQQALQHQVMQQQIKAAQPQQSGETK